MEYQGIQRNTKVKVAVRGERPHRQPDHLMFKILTDFRTVFQVGVFSTPLGVFSTLYFGVFSTLLGVFSTTFRGFFDPIPGT